MNQGIGGNRVLRDGLGPSACGRMARDVLGCGGPRWLVVFEGVNDIGRAEATEAAQKQVADDLLGAYEDIARRARAAGLLVYVATIAPFVGTPPTTTRVGSGSRRGSRSTSGSARATGST